MHQDPPVREDFSDDPAPSGRRALRFIERFCALEPRLPGTAGAEAARKMISTDLKKIGLEPQIEKFPFATTRGEIEFANVVAELAGSGPGRIVWAAHYDAPDWTEDPWWTSQFDEDQVFVGANDGGSGVAVLLELARVLVEKKDRKATHVFLFLDGEERIGPPPFLPHLEDVDANACFGARGQAQRWKEKDLLPDAFVLLDMVGDKDLKLVQETSYSDPRLLELFVVAAKKAGHGANQLTKEQGMLDDHVPFDDLGVPTIDLIDWSYGPATARGKAGAWWHSPHDTPDKLSAKSLQTTAEICVAAFPALEAFAQRD